MLLAGWGFALAALAHLALVLDLLLVRRRKAPQLPAGRALMAAAMLSLLWCAMTAVALLIGLPSALAGVDLANLLRLGAWTAALTVLVVPPGRRWPQGNSGAVAAISALLLALALAGQVLRLAGSWSPGPQLTGLTFLTLSVLALVQLEQAVRALSEDARWSAKPAGVAVVAMLCFDLYMYSNSAFFGGIDGDVFAVRGFVEALVAPSVWISLSRQGDGPFRLRVSQRAAFHSVALLLSGGYMLFVAGVGYYVRFFGGEWGAALQKGTIFLALLGLVALAVSGSMRARLKVFLGKNFFRYRYDYRDEWLKFTNALSSQATPQELGLQIVRGLADLVESPGGALWVSPSVDAPFRQSAQWNMPPAHGAEPRDGTLVAAMKEQGRVVNVDEWRTDPARYGDLAMPDWLAQVPRAWLVVPLRSGDSLTGFVLLHSPRAEFELNWEVYDLLKTAGRQAASFLAQMMATEALLEARKFDAFNRMSAFVVHDLKNIVTQLSLMLKNAKRLQSNPEFQQDMLMTVENSLEKMRQMMTQLREGVAATDGTVGVDLQQLVRRAEELANGQGRQLGVRASEPLSARGSAERLERVVGHWIQNAIDATQPNQDIWVELGRLGGYAALKVGDRGKGMTAEFVRDQLFRPFQSTKSTGMGIGAYESQQYIHELGGKISVDSVPGEGTLVSMLLPLFEKPSGSDLEILRTPGA
ncbi:putative PEP-CTERM system histidine kinase [Burkholderiales bacterium JOSHI_001]|nr:putative PEP-CTERM system histidine kinase [Burkholderiales bacterium JOSHI_001]